MPNLILGIGAGLYPLAVFFGADAVGLHVLAAVLALVLLLRLMLMPVAVRYKWAGVLMVGLVGLVWHFQQDDRWLTVYPVVLNTGFMLAFAGSLVHGTPMIERFATLRKMEVGEHNRAYLRGLTAVWAAFFAVVSVVSAYTVIHGDRALWALWNGALVYAGIGALVVGELIYRRRYRARQARAGAVDAVSVVKK